MISKRPESPATGRGAVGSSASEAPARAQRDDAEDRRVAALTVAAAVRAALRQAVIDAWEDAGIQGLCAEGREEVALGAIDRLPLTDIVEDVLRPRQPGR